MIYISIGSNLGHRLNNIQKAVSLLKERYFSDLKMSIILETPAILPNNAPTEWNKPFLNMVIQGESAIEPERLLVALKKIEQEMGRGAVYPTWGPRIIDLDILLWNNQTVVSPKLMIPHPELLNRAFLIHLIALLNPECRYKSLDENPYNNKTFGEIAHLTSNINACYDRSFVVDPKLVGIVNITPDSFSDGGQNFSPEDAVARAKQLILEGATVVELGAQSTRPTAVMLDPTVEYLRLQPVLEGLSDCIKNKEIMISIDTFLPQVILQILKDYPVSWINDVKGSLDGKTLRKIADSGLKIAIMHSLTIPAQKDQCLDFEHVPMESINQWAKQKIDYLEQFGFSKNDIILDPGIGFGKSSYQDISLFKSIHQLKDLGCEVLVGHSRKAYTSSFYPSSANERDLETIAISSTLAAQGVDYLRIHHVKNHQRFFVAQQISQSQKVKE
ncbi:MAG TPA: dihydropteroate synthase [Gammaproteobacteria bacterium]|nr:dihydropteroate synthase [Gammaproteobacteria bacterium]